MVESNNHEVTRTDRVQLATIARVLKRRRWVILGPAILGLALAFAVTWLAPPKYVATAKLLRQNTTFDKVLFGVRVFEFSEPRANVIAAAGQVKLGNVVEGVAAELGGRRTDAELVDMVKVTPAVESDLILIAAESTDPIEAADVANAFARGFIKIRQDRAQSALAEARSQVEAELAALEPEEQGGTRENALETRRERLLAFESVQTGGYEVAAPAAAPTSAATFGAPVSGIVAGVAGAIFGLLFALALQTLDSRARHRDDVTASLGVPVLAEVPIARHSGNLEPYRVLRSNLRFLEQDRRVRSLVITSSVANEGKTHTAVRLARSLAISGAVVVLVEGDLRRPSLESTLGITCRKGLTDLVLGEAQIDEVLRPLDGETHGRLHFLPPGPLPPNPAELLGSAEALAVFAALAARFDYLIIDAPPILPVPDVLELATAADGIIMVARLNLVRSEEIRRARDRLQRGGLRPLGVIVAG